MVKMYRILLVKEVWALIVPVVMGALFHLVGVHPVRSRMKQEIYVAKVGVLEICVVQEEMLQVDQDSVQVELLQLATALTVAPVWL